MLKKFFAFSIGTWIGAIFGAIAVPVLTHYFTPEEFGKASMFTLALNMLMLISIFGIDQAFVRFFYEEKTDVLLKASFKIIASIFTLISLFIFSFYTELSFFLFNEYSFLSILSLWFCVILYIIIRFGELILRMNQNGLVYSINQILLRFLDLGIVVLFFHLLGDSYHSIIAAKVVTFGIISLFLIVYNFNVWKSLFLRLKNNTFSSKGLLKYAYPLALTGLITWVFQSADRLAIKEWSSLSDLGVYVVGFRIVAVLTIIQSSFCTYWTPLALEKFISKGERNLNKQFFNKVAGIISALMILLAICVIIFKDLIPLFLGNEYSKCVRIIPFLVFMPVMYTISEVTYIGLDFYKKTKHILLISVIVCLFNVFGNVILVPFYGSLGAAISTCLSYILFLILRTHFSLKFYNVNYELSKMYSAIALLFFYALYSAFFDWNLLNPILGVILLITISFLYKEYILFLVKYLKVIYNHKKR